jgi:hypothetical protein
MEVGVEVVRDDVKCGQHQRFGPWKLRAGHVMHVAIWGSASCGKK